MADYFTLAVTGLLSFKAATVRAIQPNCDIIGVTGLVSDGRTVDAQLVKQTIAAEAERRLIRAGSVVSRIPEAAELLEKFALEEQMSDFLTLDAYDKLVSEGH
ncbi:hypothetical protein OESDEN_17522 [Oesophagostomum dentatum]|uniref:Malate synthase C-terminal domain-containing protein n=1 Tax=Oesophagostomum dentatum TaxID=61180 RepID=A0A0B1SBU9_OESDE|nr:hypothetical protein OESDEN_17522 [Oesophagostomum dentatum]